MKVKVFTKSANNSRFEKTLINFSRGVARYGDQVTISDSLTYEECDCAIIFGSWKDRNNYWHNVKRDIVAKAPKFVVLETPILGRKKVAEVMPDNWFRVGVGGFLADTGNFNNVNRSGDRWAKIQKELGVELMPWNTNEEGPIVIALQLPGDASLRGTDINKWAYNRIISIRALSDNPIVIRTPQIKRNFDLPKLVSVDENITVQEGTKENLVPTLRDAFCSITYSSGLGVDSTVAGCPTIAYNPGNFAYSISSKFVTGIHNIKRPDRTQWLHNLSYCQWSEEEMIDGKPWEHLRPVICN
jgi:hypothetical protein